jgi:hypothetical protein
VKPREPGYRERGNAKRDCERLQCIRWRPFGYSLILDYR